MLGAFEEEIPRGNSQNRTKTKSQCEIGKEYCDSLFRIEREIASLPPDERLLKRREKAIPVLNKFWNWVDHTNALSSSILGKALAYAKKQKTYLMNYLKDGECQLSNNLAESSIRPFVVGRKAWNFSASTKGAASSGIAYILIQTAKANGIDAYKYLKYLFEELPNIPFKSDPELLDAYLPWNQTVQDQCK